MRTLRPLALSAIIAIVALGASTSGILAYGKADQPLAQLTVSANCDNRSFPLCAPAPAGVGLGGIWLWIEIDTGGTSEVSGAACSHLQGVTGAGPVHGTAPWFSFHGTPAQIATAFPGTFVVGIDPGANYYVVPFGFAFPVTTGHYSTHLAPGVQVQATVAP